MTGPGSYLRMLAAGRRPALVDRAATRLRMQIEAVATCPPGQCEDFLLVIEVVNDARFFKTSRDQPDGFAALELVNDTEAHQIIEADLDRHGAAGGAAVAAESVAIAHPGLQPVEIGGPGRYARHDGMLLARVSRRRTQASARAWASARSSVPS